MRQLVAILLGAFLLAPSLGLLLTPKETHAQPFPTSPGEVGTPSPEIFTSPGEVGGLGGVIGGEAIGQAIGGLLGGGGAVPVIETNPLLNIDAAIQQWWIQVERVLVAALKHQLLQTLSNMSLNWIQGGGDPRFITDWGKYLGNAAFGAAAKWFKDLSGVDICAPYKPAITRIFDPRNLRLPLPQFECTLDRFLAGSGNVSQRLTLFKNDFAAGGGWDAWLAAISPENNPHWLVFNAALTQRAAILSATEDARAEGIAGEGAIGERKCLDTYVDDFTGEETCIQWQITTPGSLVDEIVGRYLAGPDIDYIVNTDDLASLVAAFTNLMLNRVIGAGDEGILGLQPQGIPTGGTFAQSGCAGLVGEAQTTCEQEQASEPSCGAIFQPLISVLTETRSIKQSTLTDLDTLIGALNQLKTTTSTSTGLPCRDTTAEIAARQTQKTQIQQGEIPQISAEITTLTNASCDFTPPRSITALEAEKSVAQTTRQEVQTQITAAQNELATCTAPSSSTIPSS